MEGVTPQARGNPGRRLMLAPFRGVRFASDRVSDLGAVTSPPYDLIDDDGVRRLMAAEPHNVVRLILPQEDNRGDGGRYAHAARTLRQWLDQGVLVADSKPALYVYEHVSPEGAQRGVLGGIGMAAPEERVVLPHEDVHPGPVSDRLALMRATQANLEPIFCVYSGGGPASRLVEAVAEDDPPISEVAADDGFHRLWAVTDRRSHDAVNDDLRHRQALIADGHHRYATYLRLQAELRDAGHGAGPWDYGLALLVDSVRYPPTLRPIHRVIPGLDPADAADMAREVCRVVRASDELDRALASLTDAARAGPAFLLAGGGRHYLLSDPDKRQLEASMPQQRSPRWRRLATAVLQAWLIPDVWQIHDTTATRVVHDDPVAAINLATRCSGTAVLIDPPTVDEVFTLAVEGERVPQKSTSFGPKPRTGLVLRTFADG